MTAPAESANGPPAENGSAVRMKLYASWDAERTSSPSCVPRLCTLTLTRLETLRVLEVGLQRVAVGVALKSSRRTLRSNDIELPPTGLFDGDLNLTFGIQYPHFIKRDVNVLHVMLQRRKRYKNKPIPGFKTLAVGQVNLSEVIQRHVGSQLFLFARKNKDGDAEHVATVSLSQLTSQPIEPTEHAPATSQHLHADVESSDEEFFETIREALSVEDEPAAPEGDDLLEDGEHIPRQQHRQKLQALRLLKGMAKRGLNRGKIFTFLRRVKIEGEDVGDPELEQEEEEEEEEFGVDDDDLNLSDLSDSDLDLDPDTMSVRSTPKPVLRPFYAPSTTSSSSASLRDRCTIGGNQRETFFMDVADSVPLSSSTPRKRKQVDQRTPSPYVDKIDASARQERNEPSPEKLDLFSAPNSSSPAPPPSQPATGQTSANCPVSTANAQFTPGTSWSDSSSSRIETSTSSEHIMPSRPYHDYRQRSFSAASRSIHTFDVRAEPPSSAAVEGEAIIALNSGCVSDRTNNLLSKMPPYIILINTLDPQGQALGEKMVDENMAVICTSSPEHVHSAMTVIASHLQKHTKLHATSPLGIAIVGSEVYTNTILQQFVRVLLNKSLKQDFFRFFLIPIGHNRLAGYIASCDNVYRSLFQDSQWKESFENDSAELLSSVTRRICQYVQTASKMQSLPIAQALVNHRGKGLAADGDSAQNYVYFVNDVRLGSGEALESSFDDVPPTVVTSNSQISKESGSGTTTASSSNQMSSTTVMTNPAVVGSAGESLCSTNHQSPLSSSPLALSKEASINTAASASTGSGSGELLELALDYWPLTSSANKKEAKLTMKTTLRFALISRLPVLTGQVASSSQSSAGVTNNSPVSSAFTMLIGPKERSKKVLLVPLLRKSHTRDKETVESAYITKLVCSSTRRAATLRILIDGVEWSNVKFFSLTSQWSRTLHFPIAVFTGAESSQQPFPAELEAGLTSDV